MTAGAFSRPGGPSPGDGIELLTHFARILGVPPRAFDEGQVCFARDGGWPPPNLPAHCRIVVLLQPPDAACEWLGLQGRGQVPTAGPFAPAARPTLRMASLHPYRSFSSPAGCARPVVVDEEGRAAWVEVSLQGRTWLVIGTALDADILRFRQGDPQRAADRSASAKWDFEFERPNYLFEAQLQAIDSRVRHGDHWCEAFADALARALGVPRRPLLPDGAPGALVITGDDDQAYLEKYAAQQEALAGLPITYLMHPETRHDRNSVRRMFARRRVELGLHPDALDAPGDYAARVAEQARWFESRFGFRASSLRNHGFLNDGYWGHLEAWQSAGIRFSSNLPGLDGTLLNGSLLPGRVLYEGELTTHWSILTTFGDGMVFALGLSDERAATRIGECAAEVMASGLPGVIVVNLHPQNIDGTRRVHAVLGEIARMGFVTWTMGDCRRWFEALDRGRRPAPLLAAVRRAGRRLFGLHSA